MQTKSIIPKELQVELEEGIFQVPFSLIVHLEDKKNAVQYLKIMQDEQLEKSSASVQTCSDCVTSNEEQEYEAEMALRIILYSKALEHGINTNGLLLFSIVS